MMASSGLQQVWAAFWVLFAWSNYGLSLEYSTCCLQFPWENSHISAIFSTFGIQRISGLTLTAPSIVHSQALHRYLTLLHTIWPWELVLKPWWKPSLTHKSYILHAYKTSTMQIIKSCAASSRCSRVPWRHHLLRHSSFKWLCTDYPQTMVSHVPQVTLLNVVEQNGSLTSTISISLHTIFISLVGSVYILTMLKTPSLNKLYIFHIFTFFQEAISNSLLLGKGKSVLFNEITLGISTTPQGRYHA